VKIQSENDRNCEIDYVGLLSLYRFAHIILLTAERAWAHAIHMKTSHADDISAQKIPGSRRNHVVSRLVKAAKQARILVEALEQRASGAKSSDWLEAKAYVAYLEGSAELEKHSGSPKLSDKNAQREKWQDCLENLAIARIIYSAFLKQTKKEYFKDIITTSIDPSIRFAAYQSHIPRTVPVTEVARKYFPEDEDRLVKEVEVIDATALKGESAKDGGTSGLPTSITWRSRKANIVDASIGQALVDVATAEEELTKLNSSTTEELTPGARAAAYDEVLVASQDAVDATRHAIEEHEKEKIPESDSRMQDLRVTSLSVNYDMIGWRVGRNRVLIGSRDGVGLDALPLRPTRSKGEQKDKTQKPEGRGRKLARLRERVVLYDAILQSIDSIKELRGAARDESFMSELDGKRAYFQALK
jgi:signal recognition particle subunit SRP68